MPNLVSRPRLAEHVLARGHHVEGSFVVVLCDSSNGRLLQIGAREWQLLLAADGTRDLEGIVLSARREGAHATIPAAERFFADLAALGLVCDALEDVAPAPASEHEEAPADGPTAIAADKLLEELEGYSLQCDGRGACCRSYSTVVFSQLEAARARVLRPEVLEAGERLDRAFFPHRGVELRGGLAVALVDGSCAYLESGGRCGLHAAGGPKAKPLGCRLFPALLVDDGEVVRVAPALECACVFASVGRPGGSPLLPADKVRRSDLEPEVHVETLGPNVVAEGERVESVASLRAWSRAVVAAAPVRDGVSALVALARAVSAHGLSASHARRALEVPPRAAPSDLLPYVVSLAKRVAVKAREDAEWRSEKDLARKASALVAASLEDLVDERLFALALEPREDSSREAFMVRALAFGHVFATRGPVVLGLMDHATRLFVARALERRLAETPHDEALREPIAVVEALVRGHGLANYTREI